MLYVIHTPGLCLLSPNSVAHVTPWSRKFKKGWLVLHKVRSKLKIFSCLENLVFKILGVNSQLTREEKTILINIEITRNRQKNPLLSS